MAPEDGNAPFLRIPWAAALLKRPEVVWFTPTSRKRKQSGEDSLFAEILKTPRTIRSCISFYSRPPPSSIQIDEVHTIMTIGDGMNGHPDTMHGGIVASIIDEGMGMLQLANHEREHIAAVSRGQAEGELPPLGVGTYTAQLNIRYIKPVATPAPVIVTAKYIKRHGRKEWIYAEVKQRAGLTEDYDGEEIVCATAEGLFIEPRPKKNKL
ncbi:hypothetical protein LTR37_016358 [Vermiconidia calcicola]|uniref:Uncharacterized protein n=1 Tax=Vermiconidia calcicola TaxID=1690605 RepID=A0ACC3MPN3_9PEZI|nr:hypothetical protein LTR37_016358 [Vermiconidia calcicola]